MTSAESRLYQLTPPMSFFPTIQRLKGKKLLTLSSTPITEKKVEIIQQSFLTLNYLPQSKIRGSDLDRKSGEGGKRVKITTVGETVGDSHFSSDPLKLSSQFNQEIVA